MTKTFKAWAIKGTYQLNLKSGTDKPFFMGIFFFHRGTINPWQDGMRQCLFATRKQAREHIKNLGLTNLIYKSAVVKRVEVNIKEL